MLLDIFGESCCCRVRIALSDYTVRQSKADLVELLMLDYENIIKLKFYCTGKDTLYACIIGDGFCALRNALAMAMGSVPELDDEWERKCCESQRSGLNQSRWVMPHAIMYF
jgi:hypothetical protein